MDISDNGDSGDTGDVEWLDIGPTRTRSHRHTRVGRGRRWYVLAALGLVGLVVVAAGAVAIDRHETRPSASQPKQRRSSTMSSSAPATPVLTIPVAAAPTAAVAVTDVGHSLLDVPADWELVGFGLTDMVRIQLAKGQITTTSLPPDADDTNAQVSFVVEPALSIVQNQNQAPSYVVPDGQPARSLAAPFGQQGPVLLGPDATHVWVRTTVATMVLVGLDGSPTTVSIPIPSDAEVTTSDGAGYLLYYGVGGIYDARPSGLKRVTPGTLLAIGATGWLAEECDDQDRCSAVVIDRSTGHRRILSTPATHYEAGGGVISPDGATAALLQQNQDGSNTVHLLDLTSGIDRSTGVSTKQSQYLLDQTLAWSPDSKWLGVANGSGGPQIVERSTNQVINIDETTTQIDQIAFRGSAQ